MNTDLIGLFNYLKETIDDLISLDNVNMLVQRKCAILESLWDVNSPKNRFANTALTLILNDAGSTETFLINTLYKCRLNEITNKQQSTNPLNLLFLYRNIKSDAGFRAYLFLCQKLKCLTIPTIYVGFERNPGNTFFDFVNLIDTEHEKERVLLLGAAKLLRWERNQFCDITLKREWYEEQSRNTEYEENVQLNDLLASLSS